MAFPDSDRVESAQETISNQAPEPRLGNGAVALRDRPALIQASELPSVLSTTPNVPGLLLALRRRWRLALLLGLVCAAAAAAAMWFSQSEKFTARTLVLVAANRPYIVGETPESRIEFSSYQRTQIAYIKSRLVLNAALNEPKVKDLEVVQEQIDPVVWLEKLIQADFSTAPEILRIHMTGDEPKDLIAIVNAVRDSYFKEVRSREVGWREQRLKLLKEIYAEADRKLADKRQILKGMSEDLGSTKDPKVMEHAQEMHWKTLDNLQNELLLTQQKLLKAKMEFEIQKAREVKDGEVGLLPNVIEEAIQKDAGVLDYLRKIAQYEYDLEHIKKNTFQPETERTFKGATKARDLAQKELALLRQKLRESFTKNLREKIGTDLRSSRINDQNEIAILESQHKWLDEEFNNRLSSFRGLSKRRIDVEWLRDEIKLEEDFAKRMVSQSEHLQIEMKAPDRFTLLEDAYCTPDLDSRIKKAGMAGGGTFALILFVIAFFEFRSRRVSSIDDVVRGLKMRFVGSLPTLPSRARNHAKAKGGNVQWQNQMNESIETTRTVLLHAAEAEALRLIVVTSAVGGEGKTLTCSHLAASLARAGRKTLLIDADLRRPALHRIFNLGAQPGLSELLRGEGDVAAAVQAGPIVGLSILAAGNSDDRSIQALSQPILGELFKKFRDEYDFVIVDSAPILPVADSQMICQQSDGVIFAVLRDVSRLPQIYAAHERLIALQIRILGAVVNGTDGPVYGSSYPYSRGNPAATTA